jgi:hypothetical protein
MKYPSNSALNVPSMTELYKEQYGEEKCTALEKVLLFDFQEAFSCRLYDSFLLTGLPRVEVKHSAVDQAIQNIGECFSSSPLPSYASLLQLLSLLSLPSPLCHSAFAFPTYSFPSTIWSLIFHHRCTCLSLSRGTPSRLSQFSAFTSSSKHQQSNRRDVQKSKSTLSFQLVFKRTRIEISRKLIRQHFTSEQSGCHSIRSQSRTSSSFRSSFLHFWSFSLEKPQLFRQRHGNQRRSQISLCKDLCS